MAAAIWEEVRAMGRRWEIDKKEKASVATVWQRSGKRHVVGITPFRGHSDCWPYKDYFPIMARGTGEYLERGAQSRMNI
jgi:hypothetical protein